MDDTNGFAASNGSVPPLAQNSNCSLGVCRLQMKTIGYWKLGHVFIGISTTRRAGTKWIAPLDSACQIGLFIRSYGILIVVWCLWLKQENIPEMGLDFDYIDADSGDMVEWTSAIDLVCQIGLFICSYRILIVVWECVGVS